MAQTIVLLTNYYPYRKGEEYIEHEIEYLAKAYDQILIFSTMVLPNEKKTRDLPANTKVFPVGVPLSTKDKIMLTFKARKMKSSSFTSDAKTIPQKLYESYFMMRSDVVYKNCVQKLEELNLTTSDITLYSYWLYNTAEIAVRLKQEFFQKQNPFTVSRAHGYDIHENIAPFGFLPRRHFLLHGLDEIYPVSSTQVQFLEAKYPYVRGKVFWKRLGIQGPLTSTENLPVEKTFISVSTVRKLKRIPLIIEALEVLEKKYPNQEWNWIHFGSGEDFAHIKQHAKKRLNPERYQLVGHVPNHELLTWYSEHRPLCFINVSTSEGVPFSIIEACSYGIPVIATDVGGTSDVVKNNYNGYLISKDPSPEDLANYLINFLNLDKETWGSFSVNAKTLWQEKFQSDVELSSFVKGLQAKGTVSST